MWLTEPLAYWPVLGSAGTYIGYLSGNVGAMRFPVALNLQSVLKADINTMRGQIVTIVGIVSSVVVNLGLLLIFVLGGEWVLGILPQVVIASFAFVMTGLFGSMTAMRFTGEGGLVKNIKTNAPLLYHSYRRKAHFDKDLRSFHMGHCPFGRRLHPAGLRHLQERLQEGTVNSFSYLGCAARSTIRAAQPI